MSTTDEKGLLEAHQQYLSFPVIWNSTPDAFYTMISVMAHHMNPMALPVSREEEADGFIAADADTLAAAFLEVMLIDYYPFTDYEDLQENWEPADWLMDKGQQNLVALSENIPLDDVINDTNTFLLPDPICGKNQVQFWIDAFVTRRLSKRFRIEDTNESKILLFAQLAPSLIRFPFIWNSSPEFLLEIVTELEDLAKPDAVTFTKTDRQRMLSRPTARNIAAVLTSITRVNLSPYESLEDLFTNGQKTHTVYLNARDYMKQQFLSAKKLPLLVDKDFTYVWADFFISSAFLDLNLKITDYDPLVKSLVMWLYNTDAIGIEKRISRKQLDEIIERY
jgi:hypothetical protein